MHFRRQSIPKSDLEAIITRHCGLVVSSPAWDGTGCEFDSGQCRIYIPCSLYLGPFEVLWVHIIIINNNSMVWWHSHRVALYKMWYKLKSACSVVSMLNQIDAFLSVLLQKYLNQKRKTSNQQAKHSNIWLDTKKTWSNYPNNIN